MSEAEWIEVRNPRTGQCDYRLCPPSATELDLRTEALRQAQPAWAARPAAERAAALLRLAEAFERHRPAIVTALATDTGRNRLAELEWRAVVATLRSWATDGAELLHSEHGESRTLPGIRFQSEGVPYPLVGVISPWNFPLLLALLDAIPALLAGAAVFVKPSEVAPRFVEPVRVAVAEVGALAAVLDLAAGPGALGQALIDRVDLVCFTGSVRTGRRVAAQAAARLIPVFLELGGKDPLIVLPGADPELAAAVALRGAVQASGQACQSIERIYVPRAEHDAFVAALVRLAERLEPNYPDPGRGQIGPLIYAGQAETLRAHLADARAKGARILTGGVIECLGGGLWLRPTVLTGVDHSMLVMREESFGPLLPVMAYDDLDHAVALANDSEYGLSAAVLGPDPEHAAAIARRLEVGAVSINDAALTSFVYEAEKQAFKHSGLGGSRMGRAGIRRFLRQRALLWQTRAPLPLSLLDECGPAAV